MIQENEVVAMIVGIAAILFTLYKKSEVMNLLSFRFFFPGMLFLVMGYLFDVMEFYLSPQILGFFEHSCFAMSSILFLIGCLQILYTERRDRG